MLWVTSKSKSISFLQNCYHNSHTQSTWSNANVDQCWRTLLDSWSVMWRCCRVLRFLRTQTYSFPNPESVGWGNLKIGSRASVSFKQLREDAASERVRWGESRESGMQKLKQGGASKGWVDQPAQTLVSSQPFGPMLWWWSSMGCGKPFQRMAHICSPWSWPGLD